VDQGIHFHSLDELALYPRGRTGDEFQFEEV
jgi:hypothetical protein